MLTLKPLWGYLAYHRITMQKFAEKSGISNISLWRMKKYNIFTVAQLNTICETLNLGIKDIMRYDFDEQDKP